VRRAYTAGHFQLEIDGQCSTAYIKSVDGGYARTQLVDEPIGNNGIRIKHAATVDVDALSLELGLSGAGDVLSWIQDSWEQKFSRCNGQITHANFDCVRTFEHEFKEALITETTFPTLDGASKEAAYIKIKLQPETSKARKVHGNSKITPLGGIHQKMWLASSFRFTIDGLNSMQYVNKIESFTIKQGIKKHHAGETRFAQIEPTKIEFPNLVCTISLERADEILKWYNDYIVNGEDDPDAQRTGCIEFLSPDRKKTLFAIDLYEMSLVHAEVMQSTANSDQIKRVKFELFVGRMELDPGDGLG